MDPGFQRTTMLELKLSGSTTMPLMWFGLRVTFLRCCSCGCWRKSHFRISMEKLNSVDFIAEEIGFYMRDHIIMIYHIIQWRNCFNRKTQEEKFAD